MRQPSQQLRIYALHLLVRLRRVDQVERRTPRGGKVCSMTVAPQVRQACANPSEQAQGALQQQTKPQLLS